MQNLYIMMNNNTINAANGEALDLADFRGLYDANIKEMMSPDKIGCLDFTTVRDSMYGYTFEPAYAEEELPEVFSMDYWQECWVEDIITCPTEDEYCVGATVTDGFDFEEFKSQMEQLDEVERSFLYDSPQELFLIRSILTTGDGLTPETALWVLAVHQEYEFIHRHIKYMCMNLVQQSYCNGVDCLELEDCDGEQVKLYFRVLNM